MKNILLLLFLILFQGNAVSADVQAKEWKKHPTYELKVRWHRTAFRPFVDTDGVCNVFSEDSEEALVDMYKQFEYCRTTESRWKITSQSMKDRPVLTIRLFISPSIGEYENRLIDHYGFRKYKKQNKSDIYFGKDKERVITEGFTFPFSGEDRVYGIVFAEELSEVAGHEMKHAFDGPFHVATLRGKFLIRKKGEATAKWIVEPKVDAPVRPEEIVSQPGLDIFGRP